MKMLRNPFASESLDASLSRPLILRSYLYYLILMTVLIFFWWPRNPFAAYLQAGEIPQTFFVAAIGLFASVVYLSMRFGAEDYVGEDSTKIHDLITLTPVSVATMVMGKLGAGILHTLFLLILGVPFLIVSRLASGLSYEVLWKTLLIVGSSALAYRTFSFLLFSIVESRAVLKDILLLAAAFISIIGGLTVVPPASPITAIMTLDAGGQATDRFAFFGTSIPLYMVSVIISLLAVPVFSAAAFVWLRIVRRRHAARAKPNQGAINQSPADAGTAGGSEGSGPA
jgi:hypothetical protein